MTNLLLGILMCLAGSGPAGPQGSPARASDPREQEGCIVCHGQQGQQMGRSVHAEVGLTCVACHGGKPDSLDQADAHGDDLRLLDEALDAVESCGECHSDPARMQLFGQRTDQLSLYWTSRHGEKLAEDGGADVATCVSCHGAHEVFKATDPRSAVHPLNQVETCSTCHADAAAMEPFGLSADIPALYRDSVHGKALLGEGRVSSPACADCHGSHGATPPRVQDVGQVCGHCHTVVRDYFERGPHMQAVESGEMQECVSCHGSHHVVAPSSAMLLGSGDGQCGACHEGGPGMDMAETLHAGLAGLDAMIVETERELALAATDGLFIERENGYLDEARGLRVRARALTHSLSSEALQDLEFRSAGMIGQTLENLAMKKRGLRDRKIFTFIFLLIVVLLGAVLMVYRREISGGWDPTPDWTAVAPPEGSEARAGTDVAAGIETEDGIDG